MGKCTTVYLDSKGRKHPAYYNIFKESGHTAALKNYLKVMAPVLSSNQQKNTFHDLKNYSKLIAKDKTKSLHGGPSQSKRDVGMFTPAKAKEFVYHMKARELIDAVGPDAYDIIQGMGTLKRKVEEKIWMDRAADYYDQGDATRKQLKALTEEILKGWKRDTFEKSMYHEVIEKYVRDSVSRNKAGEDYSAESYIARRGPFNYMQKEVLGNIEKFLQNRVFVNPDYDIYTEFPIDVKGWSNKGIIDLFVYDPKTNKAIIFDYKFYNENSYNFYSTKARGNLKTGTAMAGKYNNNESLNNIQMSEYTRMLQEYGITNVESHIVPFSLEIDEKASTTKATKYAGVTMHSLKPTDYLRAEIEELMQKKGVPITVAYTERYTEDKISGARAFYEHLFTGSRIKPSAVIEPNDSIDSVPVEEDEEGNKFFYHELTGELTQIQGKNKREQDEHLKAYVAIRNKFNVRLVDEIISFVQGGMQEWSPGKYGDKEGKSLIEKLREFGKKATLDKEGREDFYEQLEKTANRSFGKNKSIEGAVRKLFEGLSRDEFTFERLSNDPRFGESSHDGKKLEGITQRVIKATNKATGEIRLLTISPGSFGSMKFDHGNKKSYTTVLGAFMSDSEAAVNNVSLKDKQFNMELIALGAIMKEMRADDKNIQFMPPKVSLLRQGAIPPRSISLAEIDSILHVAGVVIKEDLITDEYRDILKTKISRTGFGTTTMAENYGIEMLDILYSSTIFYQPNLSMSAEANQLRNHMEQIKVSDPRSLSMLMAKLYELKSSMDRAFKSNELSGNRTANDEYVKITKLITALYDMDPLANFGDAQLKDALLKDVTTFRNMNNPYFTALDEVYTHAKLHVTEGMNKRAAKKDTLVKKYMKSEGVTSNSLNKQIKHDLFRKLFVNSDPSTPKTIQDDLMVLRDVKDKNLSPEGRALIKYMLDTKDEMIKIYAGETDLGKDRYTTIIDNPDYNPSAMPIFKQTSESGAEEGTATEKWHERWKAALIGRKQEQREESSGEFRTDIYNPFMEQMETPRKRLTDAGYTEDGRPSEDKDPIQLEYNFDVLFENMVLDTLTQKYYGDALQAKTAVEIQLMLQHERGEVKTTKLQQMLNTFTTLILHTGNDDAFDENGNWVRRGASATSKVVLMASPGYQLMETMNNWINLGAESWNQFVTKKLIPDARIRFTAGDVAKALQFTITDGTLSHQLARKYGMLNRDPEKMKTERFRPSMSSLFSGKMLYWLNAMPVEKVQTVILVASMMHDGSLTAHSINEDGELIYDEKRDKRFHAQEGESLTKQETKERRMFHKFYEQELSKEGGLKKDGTFNRALTFTDTATIQMVTTERMGSLSADQKTGLEAFTMGAAFGTFRRWLVSKREVWWRTYNPHSRAKKDYKLVQDSKHPEGGYYVYVNDPSEGILNSMWLFAQSHLNGSNSTIAPELQLMRKKNTIRGTNDLLLSMLLFLLFSSLFDDEEKLVRNKEGRYVKKRIPMSATEQSLYYIFMNAAGDMSFFYPIYSSFLGENASTIPMFSIVTRMATSTVGIMTAGAELDPEKSLENLNKIFRVSGAYRGGQDFLIPGVREILE